MGFSPFGGVRIIETATATEPYEDWSRVRSPARAARRMKRGFRQNVVWRRKPCAYEFNGAIYAHPEIVQQMRALPPHPRPEGGLSMAKLTEDALMAKVAEARRRFDALTPEQQKAHREAQRASYVRGMTTGCEHGVLDFEQCPDCLAALSQPGDGR